MYSNKYRHTTKQVREIDNGISVITTIHGIAIITQGDREIFISTSERLSELIVVLNDAWKEIAQWELEKIEEYLANRA